MAYPKGRPRPERRKYNDDTLTAQNLAWARHKAQAKYRGEAYELSFEDWLAFWTPAAWSMKGRGRNSICLTRKDIEGPWSRDNCELMSRLDLLRRTANWLHRIY
jgi:hypothetical protein